MQENESKHLSIDEIMRRVKKEASKREPESGVQEAFFQQKESQKLKVEPLIDEDDFQVKDLYEYNDFIKYNDIEFIKNIYRGILNREVDSVGLEYYLELLRSGDKSKSELITLLRSSEEAQKNNVKLLGFKKRLFISKLYKILFVGGIFKFFITFLTLPKLLKRINYLQNQLEQEITRSKYDNHLLNDTIKNLVIELKIRIEHLQKDTTLQTEHLKKEYDALITKIEQICLHKIKMAVSDITLQLDTKVSAQEIASELESIQNIKVYMNSALKTIQTLVEEAKERLPDEYFNKEELVEIVKEESHKLDMFYVEFEDRFRGTRKDIKERVRGYLPYIENLPFDKEQVNILDLGCGRGEWIELLGEYGYKAKGIDLNRIMIAKSKTLGLDVEQADVIKYLQSCESESLSVISGFHIIEHLPFKILMQMLDEVFRVLKPGGIAIFETPNPENLIVGACNFYTDPTHINPLVPDTVSFLMKSAGFVKNEIKRLNKYSDYYPVSEENDFITKHFYNEMDYAVIGYKR